jgi:hypothetical protein
MLVHAKTPNGIIHAGGYRIYGISWGHAPVNLPHNVYKAFKDVLVHATYREGYLTKLFNKPFPEIAFRYNELRYLPHITLDKILSALEIQYDADWPHKRKVENIKMVLRNVT